MSVPYTCSKSTPFFINWRLKLTLEHQYTGTRITRTVGLLMTNMPSCDVSNADDCSRLDDCVYVASPDSHAGNVFSAISMGAAICCPPLKHVCRVLIRSGQFG